MSLDIKGLARQPEAGVWHLTCITEGRHRHSLRSMEFEIFRPALRQRKPAKRSALAFHRYRCFRDAIKITQHARFGVLEWSPKRSPKLGGSFL
jgi:hypothetical protein